MHAPYFDDSISLTPTITSAAMLSSIPNSMRMKTPAQPLLGGAGVSGREYQPLSTLPQKRSGSLCVRGIGYLTFGCRSSCECEELILSLVTRAASTLPSEATCSPLDADNAVFTLI
jgi:hypothetical protein